MKPLSEQLDDLARLARLQVGSGKPMSLESCAGLFAALQQAGHRARALEVLATPARDLAGTDDAMGEEDGVLDIGDQLRREQQALQAIVDRQDALLTALRARQNSRESDVLPFPPGRRAMPTRGAAFPLAGPNGGDAA